MPIAEKDVRLSATGRLHTTQLCRLPRDRASQLEESLGVAYLQKAGAVLYQDFVFPRPLSCRRGAAGTAERRSEKGREYFLRYLKREPSDGEVRGSLT